MSVTDQIKALLRLTLRDPQVAARALIGMRLPDQVRWLGLALVAVLTLIVMRLTLLIFPAEGLSPLGLALRSPVSGLPIQVGSILMVALAMMLAGRVFGGRGRFADALLLMVWLEFVLSLVAVVQVLLLVALPLAGVIFSLCAVALFLWLLVNFAAALHGFTNLWAVLAAMIGTFLGLAIATALALALLGIDPQTLAI